MPRFPFLPTLRSACPYLLGACLGVLPVQVRATEAEPAPAPSAPATQAPPVANREAVSPLRPHAGSRRIDPVVLAVDRVLPSVVNISTERLVTNRNRRYDNFSDLFDQFFGGEQRSLTTSSLGSGVIVDPRGLIVTNDHVVQRASRIIVTLEDGRNFDAIPVATDETNDLALLRIDPTAATPPEPATNSVNAIVTPTAAIVPSPEAPPMPRLTAIDFGIPDDLYLGETVVTVGNPFGLGHSVASGVLSAKARRAIYRGQVLYDDILQTDAAINPGNSGGPLVNLDAELIGINLAIRADAQGIGFAIPLKRIEEVLASWMIPSRFGMNECGFVPGTGVDEVGEPYAIIRTVMPDSPAMEADLHPGDRITQIDGHPVRQGIEVSRYLWHRVAGDVISLTLDDGRTVKVTVKPLQPLSGEQAARQKLQLELQELTPRLAGALRLPYTRGLVVSGINPGSGLDRQGIQRGDVIIQVGEVPVSSFADLARALNATHPGDVVDLVIDRVQQLRGHTVLHRFAIAVPM